MIFKFCVAEHFFKNKLKNYKIGYTLISKIYQPPDVFAGFPFRADLIYNLAI